MAAERIWLDVPFAEKDEAKALGARWDARRRRWYAPRAGMAGLDRWAAAPDVPDLLPGEDRSLGSGLYVDLVPSTCWFTNVRSCVSQRDWERLRRMVVGRAGRRCEICGAAAVPAERVRLEVHERWAYDRASRVQTLKRLICLCTPCHTVTHFGLAQIRGRAAEALAHLREVTGMTDAQARGHVDDAFTVWEARSALVWSLDLSMLTSTGIEVTPPPEALSRAEAARTELERRPGTG
ncbi:DUF5710 domain-containing protein [Nocardiopsis composta]|uniref:5-methylcytosine-specific restriction endonuclease McrA n=1 Tax=Nocardiopsis composta TaxID=157465 RepID=A0A7W8QQ98_9ACTN|nr:DUF5710 domain-containing protein [Nocardiopsis composta]MBB5434642.1 5-methylcytosine-specific restriction endonuclease McrA [Nocardiopsis composta]